MRTPLLDCETILMRVHRHWALLLSWARIPAVLVLLAILFNLTLDFVLGFVYQNVGKDQGWADPRQSPLLPDLRLAVSLLLLAAAGLWLTALWVRWSSLVVTITDYRIIRDTGTWPHTSTVIGLDRVLDVSMTQTGMGKTLGYGTIKINGMDLGLNFMPDPEEFAADIFVHVTNFKRGGAAVKPGVEELLEEEAEAEAHAQAEAGEGEAHGG
jgi:hypothetical protein